MQTANMNIQYIERQADIPDKEKSIDRRTLSLAFQFLMPHHNTPHQK